MTKTHFYKGYAIHKPEGCEYWNIHEIFGGQIDWCSSIGFAKTLKEARATIDIITKKGERHEKVQRVI